MQEFKSISNVSLTKNTCSAEFKLVVSLSIIGDELCAFDKVEDESDEVEGEISVEVMMPTCFFKQSTENGLKKYVLKETFSKVSSN